MAKQITTISKILKELNNSKENGAWAVIPEISFLQAARIIPPYTIETGTDGLALKAFINKNTGEIKFYLSKWTDEPATLQLP